MNCTLGSYTWVDPENRQYLTSKVNTLFGAKAEQIRVLGEHKKEIPIKNGEDSSVVAKASETPNLVLISDIIKTVDFVELFEHSSLYNQ
ncbi:MAG: hypothetical protein NTW16_18880 [Bacteroidetes bacterium]|nr:hypothetical protein [Bacteroidota bacterium]